MLVVESEPRVKWHKRPCLMVLAIIDGEWTCGGGGIILGLISGEHTHKGCVRGDLIGSRENFKSVAMHPLGCALPWPRHVMVAPIGAKLTSPPQCFRTYVNPGFFWSEMRRCARVEPSPLTLKTDRSQSVHQVGLVKRGFSSRKLRPGD